jgi:hypothetical protein
LASSHLLTFLGILTWGVGSIPPYVDKVDEDDNFARLILKGIGSHMQKLLGMFGIFELEKHFQQGFEHD